MGVPPATHSALCERRSAHASGMRTSAAMAETKKHAPATPAARPVRPIAQQRQRQQQERAGNVRKVHGG